MQKKQGTFMTYCIIPFTLEKGGKTISQRQIHDCSGAGGRGGVFSNGTQGELLRMMDVINILTIVVVTQFKHLSKFKPYS